MSGLRDEIREQPATIRQTIKAITPHLSTLQSYATDLQKGRPVIITGMGGSFAAGTLCQFGLMESGFPALALETSELLYHYQTLLDQQPIIIMISQSGRSVEIVRLLDQLTDQSPVIGITNTPQSPLALRSANALVIQAGEEQTVSSKTYTCTLTALVLLTGALTGKPEADAVRSLEAVAQTIEITLPSWQEQAQHIAGRIRQAQFIEFLGRGLSRASALTGALITKETAKIPTEGMVGGQFRHGPIEVLAPGVVAVIFMGSGAERHLNQGLAQDIEAHGGQVIRIGSDLTDDLAFNVPAVDDFVMPLAEIVPVQLLAAELAALRGFPVGEFRHGTKVTTTE